MTYDELDLDDLHEDLVSRLSEIRRDARDAERHYRLTGLSLHARSAAVYDEWATRAAAAIELIRPDRGRGWNTNRARSSHTIPLGELLDMIETAKRPRTPSP